MQDAMVLTVAAGVQAHVDRRVEGLAHTIRPWRVVPVLVVLRLCRGRGGRLLPGRKRGWLRGPCGWSSRRLRSRSTDRGLRFAPRSGEAWGVADLWSTRLACASRKDTAQQRVPGSSLW